MQYLHLPSNHRDEMVARRCRKIPASTPRLHLQSATRSNCVHCFYIKPSPIYGTECTARPLRKRQNESADIYLGPYGRCTDKADNADAGVSRHILLLQRTLSKNFNVQDRPLKQ